MATTSTRRSTRNGGHDSAVKPMAEEDRRKDITWQQGVEEELFQLDELGIVTGYIYVRDVMCGADMEDRKGNEYPCYGKRGKTETEVRENGDDDVLIGHFVCASCLRKGNKSRAEDLKLGLGDTYDRACTLPGIYVRTLDTNYKDSRWVMGERLSECEAEMFAESYTADQQWAMICPHSLRYAARKGFGTRQDFGGGVVDHIAEWYDIMVYGEELMLSTNTTPKAMAEHQDLVGKGGEIISNLIIAGQKGDEGGEHLRKATEAIELASPTILHATLKRYGVGGPRNGVSPSIAQAANSILKYTRSSYEFSQHVLDSERAIRGLDRMECDANGNVMSPHSPEEGSPEAKFNAARDAGIIAAASLGDDLRHQDVPAPPSSPSVEDAAARALTFDTPATAPSLSTSSKSSAALVCDLCTGVGCDCKKSLARVTGANGLPPDAKLVAEAHALTGGAINGVIVPFGEPRPAAAPVQDNMKKSKKKSGKGNRYWALVGGNVKGGKVFDNEGLARSAYERVQCEHRGFKKLSECRDFMVDQKVQCPKGGLQVNVTYPFVGAADKAIDTVWVYYDMSDDNPDQEALIETKADNDARRLAAFVAGTYDELGLREFNSLPVAIAALQLDGFVVPEPTNVFQGARIVSSTWNHYGIRFALGKTAKQAREKAQEKQQAVWEAKLAKQVAAQAGEAEADSNEGLVTDGTGARELEQKHAEQRQSELAAAHATAMSLQIQLLQAQAAVAKVEHEKLTKQLELAKVESMEVARTALAKESALSEETALAEDAALAAKAFADRERRALALSQLRQEKIEKIESALAAKALTVRKRRSLALSQLRQEKSDMGDDNPDQEALIETLESALAEGSARFKDAALAKELARETYTMRGSILSCNSDGYDYNYEDRLELARERLDIEHEERSKLHVKARAAPALKASLKASLEANRSKRQTKASKADALKAAPKQAKVVASKKFDPDQFAQSQAGIDAAALSAPESEAVLAVAVGATGSKKLRIKESRVEANLRLCREQGQQPHHALLAGLVELAIDSHDLEVDKVDLELDKLSEDKRLEIAVKLSIATAAEEGKLREGDAHAEEGEEEEEDNYDHHYHNQEVEEEAEEKVECTAREHKAEYDYEDVAGDGVESDDEALETTRKTKASGSRKPLAGINGKDHHRHLALKAPETTRLYVQEGDKPVPRQATLQVLSSHPASHQSKAEGKRALTRSRKVVVPGATPTKTKPTKGARSKKVVGPGATPSKTKPTKGTPPDNVSIQNFMTSPRAHFGGVCEKTGATPVKARCLENGQEGEQEQDLDQGHVQEEQEQGSEPEDQDQEEEQEQEPEQGQEQEHEGASTQTSAVQIPEAQAIANPIQAEQVVVVLESEELVVAEDMGAGLSDEHEYARLQRQMVELQARMAARTGSAKKEVSVAEFASGEGDADDDDAVMGTPPTSPRQQAASVEDLQTLLAHGVVTITEKVNATMEERTAAILLANNATMLRLTEEMKRLSTPSKQAEGARDHGTDDESDGEDSYDGGGAGMARAGGIDDDARDYAATRDVGKKRNEGSVFAAPKQGSFRAALEHAHKFLGRSGNFVNLFVETEVRMHKTDHKQHLKAVIASVAETYERDPTRNLKIWESSTKSKEGWDLFIVGARKTFRFWHKKLVGEGQGVNRNQLTFMLAASVERKLDLTGSKAAAALARQWGLVQDINTFVQRHFAMADEYTVASMPNGGTHKSSRETAVLGYIKDTIWEQLSIAARECRYSGAVIMWRQVMLLEDFVLQQNCEVQHALRASGVSHDGVSLEIIKDMFKLWTKEQKDGRGKRTTYQHPNAFQQPNNGATPLIRVYRTAEVDIHGNPYTNSSGEPYTGSVCDSCEGQGRSYFHHPLRCNNHFPAWKTTPPENDKNVTFYVRSTPARPGTTGTLDLLK